ncbi:hypothetical protein [Paenibacillus silvae]|uniref:hypothetical protein n=1 Tax=Paenibacillus silvae TaxID=1325358 RepID=UPI00142E8D9D|nr:hypothetical protein [Paenibacillus silvae]
MSDEEKNNLLSKLSDKSDFACRGILFYLSGYLGENEEFYEGLQGALASIGDVGELL